MAELGPNPLGGDSPTTPWYQNINWGDAGKSVLGALPVLAAFGSKPGESLAQGSSQNSRVTKEFGAESDLEKLAREQQFLGYKDLLGGQGTAADYKSAQQQASVSNESLASMLAQLQQTGGIPGTQDWSAASGFAQQATAPLEFQNQLAMRQAEQTAARQAGLSGRSGMDFTFQRGLAQTRADLAGALGAQQSQIASQYAQQLPMQRLGFAQDLAQLRQGLASQAMQNRMAIMQLGSNIQGQQFGQRAQQASVVNQSLGGMNQSTSGRSGNRLGSALSGAAMGAQVGGPWGAAAGGIAGLAGLFG